MTEEPIFEACPTVDKKALFRSQIPLVLTELALVGIMIGVYALLKKFALDVVLGAAIGTAVSLLNHGAMILSLLKAEKAEDPAKGQLQVRGTYILRMILLLAVLVFALKSGYFNVLATLLPLAFMRIAIFVSELFTKRQKKGGTSWTSA